jgi:hypothetical protein
MKLNMPKSYILILLLATALSNIHVYDHDKPATFIAINPNPPDMGPKSYYIKDEKLFEKNKWVDDQIKTFTVTYSNQAESLLVEVKKEGNYVVHKVDQSETFSTNKENRGMVRALMVGWKQDQGYEYVLKDKYQTEGKCNQLRVTLGKSYSIQVVKEHISEGTCVETTVCGGSEQLHNNVMRYMINNGQDDYVDRCPEITNSEFIKKEVEAFLGDFEKKTERKLLNKKLKKK